MVLVILFLIGGILGWIISIVADLERHDVILVNAISGVIGALLAAQIIAADAGSRVVSVSMLLWATVGAVAVIVAANIIRRSVSD